MPAWTHAPSGMRSATSSAMRWSTASGTGGGTSTSGRSTSHHPATCERCKALRPMVRGIRALASRKNGTLPMNGAT